ncbi:uncharacterized protein LOC132182029 [Corylus avellana]|uniref:uncharacterized protein LOC132182029 n=1 Tax=Corylus avellana TaxID=13451 RepID=UPI00286D3A32|nr:uncharacterized protein LOC132182029 [Corylus avellana]
MKESLVWKIIWKLPLPNAAKIFFWRACQNVLPTEDNLLRRKVVKEPYCPICEKEPETVVHALWGCPAATDVWGCSKKIFQKCATEGVDFLLLAEQILSRCGSENSVLFVHLACQIWWRRNKWVHDGTVINPNVIIQETTKFVEEYKRVNEAVFSAHGVSTSTQSIRWLAPNRDWYKANWDAAFENSTGRMGIGVVVRDDRGRVVVTLSKPRMGSFEPTTGEAYAAFHAMCMCRNLGIQCLYLEGDAKLIVDAINSSTKTCSRYDHIVEDSRSILNTFPKWKCGFIHREANEAAHRHAKAAITDVSDRIWGNDPHDCIRDIVLREQIALSLDC